MIITAILNIIFFVIKIIIYPISVLPDVTLPSGLSSSLGTASGYLNPLNGYIPIDTMLIILEVFLTFELAYFAYKGIMWIIKKIPTIN